MHHSGDDFVTIQPASQHKTANVEREIASLAEGSEVLLVWRRGQIIDDEVRGFWRYARAIKLPDGREINGPRKFYRIVGRRVELIVGQRPTHFVPSEPMIPAPPAPPPDLERPERLDQQLERMWCRVRLACDWEKALTDKERNWLRCRTHQLPERPGPGDYPPEQVTRFRATARESSEAWVTWVWLARLKRHDKALYDLLRLRWMGLTNRSAAERLGVHERTARMWMKAGLKKLLDYEAEGDGRVTR